MKKHILLIISLLSFSVFGQEINKLDANGKRTGVWKKNYESGNIRYTGQFVNGVEVGIFKFYENRAGATPSATKEYTAGSNLIKVKFFTRKGKLKAEGNMIGKERTGKWKFYFKTGNLLSIENYKNGKLDGLSKNFYPDGKITSEVFYSNGLKNGSSKTYSNKGKLIEETNFLNGKYDGKTSIYDTKGNLSAQGSYTNGKRNKDWIFYSPDGEVIDTKKKKGKLTKGKISKLYRE